MGIGSGMVPSVATETGTAASDGNALPWTTRLARPSPFRSLLRRAPRARTMPPVTIAAAWCGLRIIGEMLTHVLCATNRDPQDRHATKGEGAMISAGRVLAIALLFAGCSAPMMFMPLAELRSLPPDRTLTAADADYRDVAECIADEVNAAKPLGSSWDEPLLFDWTLLDRRALRRATVTGSWSMSMMSVPAVDLTITQQGNDVRIDERIGRFRDDTDPARGLRKSAEYFYPVIARCASAPLAVTPPTATKP